MAIALGILTFIALCGFCLALACLGLWILRSLRLEMQTEGEHLLVAIAVGLVTTEILIFLIQLTQHVRQGCLAIVVLLCIPLLSEWNSVGGRCRRVFREAVPRSKVGSVLLLLIAMTLFVEFLISLAPLTGSDALQYHFTVPKIILEQGFHPIFSNSSSFLCGQHHLLILFGLALGSEKLALGFVFLGGVLTAASLACLASRLASQYIAAGVTLLFLLTPVVFWQMSSSGAPDIYMAFLASAALIVLGQSANAGNWKQALLAGFLVGGIAGAKYTGCVLAAAVALALIIEFRSGVGTLAFGLGALLGGIWPYLRNLVWTGNPVFPFLSGKLSPNLVTAYAMTSLARDTGASSIHNPAQLLPFLFYAAMQPNNPGFWDFFGPTVFALAPLIFLAFQNTRAWRISAIVWFVANLGVFFVSGLPRYLLPVFPIALSCVAAGIDDSFQRKWRITSFISVGLIALMVLAGAAGLAVYSRKPIMAAVGLKSKVAYLEDTTQDYQVAQAVNRLLDRPASEGRTLVFLRHLYFLSVPYVNGDPGTSFEVDPEHLRTPQQWKAFFDKERIAYVARSPGYPSAVAASLEEMERNGDLLPFAQTTVENFQGKRIDQVRVTIPVVILKVHR
jgi:hypothetical protein